MNRMNPISALANVSLSNKMTTGAATAAAGPTTTTTTIFGPITASPTATGCTASPKKSYKWEKLSPREFFQLQELASCK